MKLIVDFYKLGQQSLKEGSPLSAIRELPIVTLLLKARMDIKDDEMPKLDKLENDMQEQFKNISGVKVTNWPLKAEFNIARLLKLKDL